MVSGTNTDTSQPGDTMTAPLYAITATDDNGNDWYAVNEPLFGGWCAMTREDMILFREKADTFDQYGYDHAVAVILPEVIDALPAFSWSVARFQ
jgi:hypothetical protein